jgi:serine/threonine-protein kinase
MQEDDITTRARGQVGRVLRDKWRLDRLLGVGGMASVFAATHRNGSRVAVKMLHQELSMNAEIKRRFLREGYVANAVAHRGSVRALDDDTTEDGTVFLVLELLEGRSLESRLQRNGKPLGPEEVVFIADQLLDVLEAAHQKGIVHRDIKPDNVFLTPDGIVKVLDFGIARLRLESDSASMATQTGATMGTPAFMSPEQALGKANLIGPCSDIWSVGATLYALLTGRLVHEGETANEQLILAATRPAPSLAASPGAIPLPLAQIVDRALAFERDDRWPSARAMQQALREMHDTDTASYVHTARTIWDADIHEPAPAAVIPFASPDARAAREAPAAQGPTPTAPRRPLGLIVGLGVGGVAALITVLVMVKSPPGPAPVAAASAPASATQATAIPAAISAVSPTSAASEAPAASTARIEPAAPPSAASITTRPAGKPGGKSTTKVTAPAGDWLDRQH